MSIPPIHPPFRNEYSVRLCVSFKTVITFCACHHYHYFSLLHNIVLMIIPSQIALSLLRRVHLLELVDSSLQSVLHHIAQIKVGLSDLCVAHHKNSLDILQGKSVAFDTFKGLGSSDESLDVFGVDLKDCRTIRNDSVKVGDLLVTRCDCENENRKKKNDERKNMRQREARKKMTTNEIFISASFSQDKK